MREDSVKLIDEAPQHCRFAIQLNWARQIHASGSLEAGTAAACVVLGTESSREYHAPWFLQSVLRLDASKKSLVVDGVRSCKSSGVWPNMGDEASSAPAWCILSAASVGSPDPLPYSS
jgi:hypothetical protein